MSALDRQLHITSAHAMREQVAPVANSDMSGMTKKPQAGTGLWTSTYDEERGSAWVEWCDGENVGTPSERRWFLLTPRPDARVYVIDSPQDLERVIRAYPWVSPELEHAYRASRASARLAEYYTGIDFTRMAQDYDALHLTEDGNAHLHLRLEGMDMNAWDCESTVWFRWCFTSVKQITPKVREHSQ